MSAIVWGSVINTEQLLFDAINHYENDEMQLAISKFEELAKINDEEAILYLSLIYKEGDGLPQDELKAKRLKKRYVDIVLKKANSGDLKSKLKYAYILQYGDGIQADEKQAFLLFEELANDDTTEAQFHLYTIFHHGFCLQNPDPVLADYWLNKAFDSNWPEAIYITALRLLSNNDGSQEAIRLLEKASSLDFFPATELLNTIKRN